MRNPLKRLTQHGVPKPTLRERAALLKASAARVIRRWPAVHPTDQPSGETLIPNTVLDRGNLDFRGRTRLSHQRREGVAEGKCRDGAVNDGKSQSEKDMGRHEKFDTAQPLAESLLSGTAIGAELLEGVPCPPGFMPFPMGAPTGFAEISCGIERIGVDLLMVARSELRRHRKEAEAYDWWTDDQRRSFETLQERILHMDALAEVAGLRKPDRRPLPEIGSEAARTAFQDACRKVDLATHAAVHGYPELRRDEMVTWTTDDLQSALETGKISVADFARLYPLAGEREQRIQAAAAAANLHVLYALANPPEVELQGDGVEGPQDPAEHAILRHQSAWTTARPLLDAWSAEIAGTPEFEAAQVAMMLATEAEADALDALLDADAASLRGALALARYLPSAVRRDSAGDADTIVVKALDAMCRNLTWLAKVGRILPHACPMPTPRPAPFAPVGLADACEWAVRHVDWFNAYEWPEQTTDEDTSAELDKSDAVWGRACDEPGLDLGAIAAKARMLRHSWVLAEADVEQSEDGHQRLALKIVNDVIALADAQVDGTIDDEAQSEVQIVRLPPVSDLLAEALLKAWANYASLHDDETPEGEAAFQRAARRRDELIAAAERLPATRTSLPTKALALAWIQHTDLWVRGRSRSDYATDGRLALDIDAIATGAPTFQTPNGSDPTLLAIAISRFAEAEMKGWSDSIRDRATRLTKTDFAEEDRLGTIQSRARDTALATVPTTRAGQIALVEYVQWQMDLHGMANGEPPDDDAHIWRQTHAALMAALGAEVPSPGPDLSKVPLRRLGNLQETFRSLLMHASGELQAPWCFDEKRERYNDAGKVLDAESDRLARMADAVANEARGRVPASNQERNDRLEVLLRHELLCEGRVADQGLMSEMVAAWSA